ncbi:hypothetical protein GCM10011584_03820 [Nocardioides phosphati]|uniref:DUF2752 domain-containing protein n=1 Tax=Nocardioides phosphati TaxID=1867775 RepID=A0ABQ2N6T9_9ACTN|nr:DUF2752 domain-containing protein [Nocardioides phosphati]GGO84976.1 hypothetical protein GCM10011584_03820 [Nocardioides phosphati]
MKLAVEPADRIRWLTIASAGLVAIAGAMAIFGLPPVDLHGPDHWFGIMDPLCGGTRAARYTAMGQWGQAWRYNPLGIVVVLMVSALLLRGAVGLATRRWLTLHISWTPRTRMFAITAAVVLVALLEVRQQGRADLLMRGTFTLVDKPAF